MPTNQNDRVPKQIKKLTDDAEREKKTLTAIAELVKKRNHDIGWKS